MRYWIGPHDELADVDEEWDAFASENGAPELTSRSILGRPLASFCGDATTNAIWAELYERVRGERPVCVRIRCDAPARRRLLEVSATLEPGRRIAMASVPVSEEARSPVALLEARRPATGDDLVCCSWCKKWLLPREGGWVEAEALVQTLGLMEEAVLPAISHGICAVCRVQFLSEARQVR